jgi:hypothetical protein
MAHAVIDMCRGWSFIVQQIGQKWYVLCLSLETSWVVIVWLGYGLDGPEFECQEQEIFLFFKTFKPALGPIQPPI